MHCVDSQSDEIGEERDDSRQLLTKGSIINRDFVTYQNAEGLCINIIWLCR